MFWRTAFTHWDDAVANDLHQAFGIDLGEDATWRKPWWWLRSRILGLMDWPESRLVRHLREAASST